MKKTKKVIRIILLVIVSAIFLMSAYGKFTGSAQEVELFSALGLESFRIAAGLINVIIVLTLWWKPTRNVGTLIASSYLGSAILATLQLAPESVFMPGIILLMVWTIAKLSHKCGWCMQGGHCHCGCDTCKNCTVSDTATKPEMCNCKPGCVCEKGVCSC